MVKIAWPALGSIYVVSVILAALNWENDVTLGPITFLAWVVVIAGPVAFVAWAIARIYSALTGRGVGA